MNSLRKLMLVVMLTTAAAATLLAAPRVAHAQDAALENARKEFERGQVLFEKADYQGAADAFMAAYQAKPFSAFLFNAAVCYEKLNDLKQAVELFRRYLKEDPKAADRDDVNKRIKLLEEEIARQAAPPPPDGQPPPDKAVVLPEVKTKGLVVIDSKPQGATIWLDNKKGESLGETPWSGSLQGDHTVIVEYKGYKTEKRKISPRSDKFIELYLALSTDENLGWLEVTANIPGSDVFLDSREVGAVGQTPWRGNIQEGKHKIIIYREGYTEVVQDVTIVGGQTHNVNVKLEEAAVGFVKVRVDETGTGARVRLDGKVVCAKAPCRFEAPEGTHTVSVGRGGKKPLNKRISIVRRTESTVFVRLAPKPSRADAFWPFLFSGMFAGGGYYLYTMFEDEKAKPLADQDDQKLQVFEIGSYGAFGLAGATFLTGCWYLIRDKGPPSTAKIDSKDLTWAPAVGPGYTGFTAVGVF